jgi:hypothetical protein
MMRKWVYFAASPVWAVFAYSVGTRLWEADWFLATVGAVGCFNVAIDLINLGIKEWDKGNTAAGRPELQ